MARAELRVQPDEDGLLLPVVREALRALREDPAHRYSADKAMHRLAETYARRLDQHVEVLDAAMNLLDTVAEDDTAELGPRVINAIRKFTESVATLNDLGPRLQSVLESLGASPKARAQMTGSRGGGNPDVGAGKGEPAEQESSLERRRRESAEREARARGNGSATVDSSAS